MKYKDILFIQATNRFWFIVKNNKKYGRNTDPTAVHHRQRYYDGWWQETSYKKCKILIKCVMISRPEHASHDSNHQNFVLVTYNWPVVCSSETFWDWSPFVLIIEWSRNHVLEHVFRVLGHARVPEHEKRRVLMIFENTASIQAVFSNFFGWEHGSSTRLPLILPFLFFLFFFCCKIVKLIDSFIDPLYLKISNL